jgi:hypothetical protein
LTLAKGDGRGVVSGVGFDFGVAEGSDVSPGLALGFGVAGALGDGLGVSFFLVVVFFFLRGVGVGVRTKKSLNFFWNDSSCSSTARTGATTANAAKTTIKIRRILVINSGGQFFEHSLIDPNAGVEILQRKIFIG